MDLKNNPELIAKYIECHNKVNSWPEIRAGIRAVGILEMEVYVYGNHLFMIVETPLDFDWDTAMKRLSSLPRQKEWEKYVSAFQQCDSDASSDQKWQLMDRMSYLYE
jgi:L-rhamnose mutarotase